MVLSGLLAVPQAPPTLLAHPQVLLMLLMPMTIVTPIPNQEAHSLFFLTSHIKFCGFHFLKILQILPTTVTLVQNITS